MNLEVKKFVERDLRAIKFWCLARMKMPPKLKHLPEVGFVVWEGEKRIACAFLRRVEGNFGIYDSMATNPAISGPVRNEALDLLFEKMCNVAKEHSLLALLAHTADKSTIERSLRYGFRQLPGTIIAKDLA